jgi:coproporphyrinogen III oxidase-like Fe-S oxidoreductase
MRAFQLYALLGAVVAWAGFDVEQRFLRDDAWLNRRTALHDRFLEVAKCGDASRLAYLHGAEQAWSEEEVAAMWERAVRDPVSPMAPLNCVYVHVPFCKSICSFCNYDRLQPSSPLLLKNWLARVLRSIEVIGRAVRPLTFHALYIGGGTPSVLPANLMHELLEALDRTLSWHRRAQRKLEFDPAVMNRERLKVLAAHRITELSFGIETLDPEINARHNRGRQGIETIERCFSDLNAMGISDVACDFLLGLEGTTPEGMLAEMETVLRRFRPAGVDIFMITPTQAYLTSHFAGSWEAFWRHIKPFEVAVPAALPELAARTGYRVLMGQGHHMKLERRNGFFRAAGSRFGGWPMPIRLPKLFRRQSYTPLTSVAHRPVNVVGLGRSARSVIFGTAAFAARDPEDNPAIAGPASYVGNQIDVGDEARSFLAHLLRDHDEVDRNEFRRIFGGDVTEIIPTALAGWENERTARLENGAVRFVPQDRRDRIRSLLWLVPEEAIEFDLAHFDQLELTPSGVARLVEAIRPGTALANQHTFEGTEGTRLLVRTPEGETLRLRIAPELREGGPLRLVLDRKPRTGDEDALRRAVAQLSGVVTQRHRQMTGRRTSRA